MTSRVRFDWLSVGLLCLGLLLVGTWFTGFLESRGFQAAETRKLETALRRSEAGRPESHRFAAVASHAEVVGPRACDSPGTREPLSALGKIEIPRLRIEAIVAEGTDAKTLGHAIGHVAWTALPGGAGNCALAGHRDTFLRGLGGVRMDDLIRIVTLDRTYLYQVEWSAVVEPRQVEVLDSTSTRSLTLVTCYPFAYIGHAPRRFVVRARQIEPMAASSTSDDRVALQSQGLAAEGR